MERGKVKCHKYWPKKAEEVQYWGAFQVKNTKNGWKRIIGGLNILEQMR